MAFLNSMLTFLFGDAPRKTIEIFRANSEAKAIREETRLNAALSQFSTEFQLENRSGFDRFIDGINRLPRPLMAFGIIGLFTAAMTDPEWFIARMQGLSFVPEPLWWLLGAIVSFYFGARHHAKNTEFHTNIARLMTHAKPIEPSDENAAIVDWQKSNN
jgi:hypothetical protein